MRQNEAKMDRGEAPRPPEGGEEGGGRPPGPLKGGRAPGPLKGGRRPGPLKGEKREGAIPLPSPPCEERGMLPRA